MEQNHKRVFRSTVFLTFIFLVNIAARSSNSFNGGPILCPFRLITGLPCPLCGTTRAFGYLSQGELWQSALLNPLALVITAIALMWVLYPAYVHDMKDRIVRFWWKMSERNRISFSLTIFTMFWVANLPRMLNP